MQKQATENQSKKVAARLIFLQIIITLLGSLSGFIVGGAYLALSACVGGSVGIIGTFLLSAIMFTWTDASPKQILFAFYLGEATKILTTIAIFIVVFAFLDLHVLSFMLTYMATLAMNWLYLIMTGN